MKADVFFFAPHFHSTGIRGASALHHYSTLNHWQLKRNADLLPCSACPKHSARALHFTLPLPLRLVQLMSRRLGLDVNYLEF